MMATRTGGSTPEQALKLYLKAISAADLDAAMDLLTGEQEKTWRAKIERAGEAAAKEGFRRISTPSALDAVLDRDELVDGSVRIHARVRVERDGQTVTDTVTPTFGRDTDGLWRIASF